MRDSDGRLLLVLRTNEPAAGTWSLPGGRVEPGEDDATAVRRELLEETALPVDVGPLLGTVERGGPRGVVYVIADYACRITEPDPARPTASAQAVAGDDAGAVGWFRADELATIRTAPGLVTALRDWGVVP